MRSKNVAGALGVFAATLCVGNAADSKDVPIVEINGQKLNLADLQQKKPVAWFQANADFYSAERKAIDELIEETVIKQQAYKEGLTVDQLMDKHVKSQLPADPTEEALHIYYEGLDTTEPYEGVRDKIVDALRERRSTRLKTAYIKSLMTSANVIMLLAPPRAPLSMNGVPHRGSSTAPITVLEFADFECPVCQQIQPTVDRLELEFKGKIQVAYKDYPLSQHPHAEKAAEAAHCAEAQGKYWEFHDIVLAEKRPDVPSLKAFARDLKLDTEAFNKCLDSGAKADVVKANLSEATTLGLQGTPTFFVNGRYVSGNITYDKLKSIINEELSAVENRSAGTPAAKASRDNEK